MHIELARALAPLVQDLTTTGAPVPRVVDDGWAADPGSAGAMLWDDGGTHGGGVSVRLGLPRAEQVVQVAAQVQEWSAAPWPPCPHHPAAHSLRAAVADGAARWTCPADGTVVAVVGTLR